VGIQNSGNIASVTRTALGTYSVTFVAAMPDANYVVVALPTNTALGAAASHVPRVISQTTTGFTITSTRIDTNAAADVNQFAILVLR
jgi:hypothetical protein